MTTGWLLAAVTVPACGLAACPLITRVALRAIGRVDTSRSARVTSAVAGVAAGAIAVTAAHHAGSLWWLPSFVIWALALAVAAICDAITQRVPRGVTALGTLLVATTAGAAALATHDQRAASLTAIAVVSTAFIFASCWRFGGLGFGDVRLAVLASTGLGHASSQSVAVGVAAFSVIALGQALWTIRRTGDRKALLPFGPAIAAGFLIAGTA